MDGRTDLVIQAMLNSPRPMTTQAISRRSYLKSDIVRRRLEWLEERGRAIKIGKGAWRLAEIPSQITTP
jgi:predicted ArsR family transcriptional regulator